MTDLNRCKSADRRGRQSEGRSLLIIECLGKRAPVVIVEVISLDTRRTSCETRLFKNMSLPG